MHGKFFVPGPLSPYYQQPSSILVWTVSDRRADDLSAMDEVILTPITGQLWLVIGQVGRYIPSPEMAASPGLCASALPPVLCWQAMRLMRFTLWQEWDIIWRLAVQLFYWIACNRPINAAYQLASFGYRGLSETPTNRDSCPNRHYPASGSYPFPTKWNSYHDGGNRNGRFWQNCLSPSYSRYRHGGKIITCPAFFRQALCLTLGLKQL